MGGCQPFPPPPSSSPAVHTLRKAWTLSPALGTLPVPGVSPDGPPTVPPFAPLSLHSFCLWPLNSDYFFFTFMGEGWAIGCALVAAANSHIPPLLALALPGQPRCQGTEPGLRAAHRERGPFSSSHLAPLPEPARHTQRAGTDDRAGVNRRPQARSYLMRASACKLTSPLFPLSFLSRPPSSTVSALPPRQTGASLG